LLPGHCLGAATKELFYIVIRTALFYSLSQTSAKC
jgi:hypothetical protein